MNTSSLVQKVWNFCHTLRDDGGGYGDYLEQLTYLMFLKLAHEYAVSSNYAAYCSIWAKKRSVSPTQIVGAPD